MVLFTKTDYLLLLSFSRTYCASHEVLETQKRAKEDQVPKKSEMVCKLFAGPQV